jgi:hypothetical protein
VIEKWSLYSVKLPNFVRSLSLSYLILIGLWGCAGKPFTPPEANEIPEGPGLFTKEKGAVEISTDLNNESSASTSPAKTSEPPAGESANFNKPSDYEEFRAYQQWLEWKSFAIGSPEYEEFRQWLEWKKYQQWEKKRAT